VPDVDGKNPNAAPYARGAPAGSVDPDSGQIRRTYYRHGELALLLELKDPGPDGDPNAKKVWSALNQQTPPEEFPSIDDDTLADLEKFFTQPHAGSPPLSDQGIGLSGDPTLGPWGKPRPSVPMARGEHPAITRGALPVLQVVNLKSWIPDPVAENDPARLDPAIRDVAVAVTGLNALISAAPQGEPIRLGPYRLLAASPNWLALPFQG